MTGTRPLQQQVRLDDLAWRIRTEFTEMPGLHLTLQQIARLWPQSREDSGIVLDALVEGGFLARDEHGRFCRQQSWIPGSQTRSPNRQRNAP